MSDKKLTTKLGTTRAGERTRIWIEGARLVAHGFPVGSKIQKVWGDGKLVITSVTEKEFDELEHAARGKVSGKGEKPIIDITGVKVSETFKGTHVAVVYREGRITVTNDE
jgi:hypothetical protein